MVEQPPHCDPLRLSLSTDRFVRFGRTHLSCKHTQPSLLGQTSARFESGGEARGRGLFFFGRLQHKTRQELDHFCAAFKARALSLRLFPLLLLTGGDMQGTAGGRGPFFWSQNTQDKPGFRPLQLRGWLTATTFTYATGAGMTAAAGTEGVKGTAVDRSIFTI